MNVSSGMTARVASAALAAVTILGTVAQPAAASVEPRPTNEAPVAASPWKDLHAKAKKSGEVPVIIELSITSGEPDFTQLGKHKAKTKDLRGKVLRELGRNEADVADFGELPLIAMSATEADLVLLEKSSHVRSVHQDRELDLGEPARKGKAVAVGKTRPVKGDDVPADAGTAGTSPFGAADGVQLANWWDYYLIGVDKAAAAGRTGSGQVVAILDSGVDRTHPWLAGDVVREACFASRVQGATTGDCPNGRSEQTGTGSAAPCVWNLCAHGTHVAHTAAGLYGVASGARIIAVQVFHWTAAGIRTWDSDYIKGLWFVYNLRASYSIAAVNMSIGGDGFTGYCDTQYPYITGAINALSAVKIATVISSGNDDYTNAVGLPGCISGAISVGNTTLDQAGYEAVLGYTKYGSNSNVTLDLLAPGTDICSAVPGAKFDCGYYGTSMAAPHVAGAVAVLKQKRPAATVSQVLNALYNSGPAVYDARNGISRIRINVFNALAKLP